MLARGLGAAGTAGIVGLYYKTNSSISSQASEERRRANQLVTAKNAMMMGAIGKHAAAPIMDAKHGHSGGKAADYDVFSAKQEHPMVRPGMDQGAAAITKTSGGGVVGDGGMYVKHGRHWYRKDVLDHKVKGVNYKAGTHFKTKMSLSRLMPGEKDHVGHVTGMNSHSAEPDHLDGTGEYKIMEVQSHAKRDDCWITYRDQVYDITHFIENHPGGAEMLLKAAGGPVDKFFDMFTHHEERAKDTVKMILEESHIGHLTDYHPDYVHDNSPDDIQDFMKMQEKTAKIARAHSLKAFDHASVGLNADEVLLNREKTRLTVSEVETLSPDVKRFRLLFPADKQHCTLGLPTGNHFKLYMANPNYGRAQWNGIEDSESSQEIIERQYTPVSHPDMKGSVDLAIKIYRPETIRLPNGKELHFRNGGKVTKTLDSFMPGDSFEVAGPFGLTEYKSRGVFSFPGAKKAGAKTEFKQVGMLAGGSGITPFLQIVQKALSDPEDTTVFSLIYANKTETDILCKEIIDDMSANSNGRFRVLYTLDYPSKDWAGRGTNGNHRHGFISEEMIKNFMPAKEEEPMMLMCGPPPMVEHACKKNLNALGYNSKWMVCV